MQIPVVTTLPDGSQPPAVIMSRLRESGALAGVRGCGSCPSLSGLGIWEGSAPTSLDDNGGGSGWGSTIQTIAQDWSRIGGQLLLNRNPAPVYRQTAAGTTVYAQTGVPATPTSSSGWVVPALMVGGVLVVLMVMKNR